MEFKKLLQIFEAPDKKQTTVGSRLAQISGGQFMNKRDRLNQAKVDAILGPGYKAGKASTNLALEKYFKQQSSQSTPATYAPTISDRAAAGDVNVNGTRTDTNTDTNTGDGQDLAAMAKQGTAMRKNQPDISGDYTVNDSPEARNVPFTPRNTTGYDPKKTQYMYTDDGKPNPLYRSGEADPAWVTMGDVNAKKAEPPKPRLGEPNIIPPEFASVPLPANVGNMNPEDSARELRAAQAAAGKTVLEPGAKVVSTGTGGSMTTGTGGLLTTMGDAERAWRNRSFANQNAVYPGAEAVARQDAETKARGETVKKWFKDTFGFGNKDSQTPASAEPPPNNQNSSYTNPQLEENMEKELEEMMRLSGLQLNEKAVSVAQQQTAAIELKKRKEGKKKSKSGMGSMSTSELKKFAGTKHKDLPKHVNESVELIDETRETLKHIANRFKYETKMFMQSGHMEQDLFHALYDYYRDKGEMPYSVAKGDPQPWVEEHFYMDMGSGMSESTKDLTELALLAGLHEDNSGKSWKDSAKSAAKLYVDAWSNVIDGNKSDNKFKDVKPVPMPLPKGSEIKSVPMLNPSTKGSEIKSVPMPSPGKPSSMSKNDVDEAVGDASKMTPPSPNKRMDPKMAPPPVNKMTPPANMVKPTPPTSPAPPKVMGAPNNINTPEPLPNNNTREPLPSNNTPAKPNQTPNYFDRDADEITEWGDSPLNRIQQPQSQGAAPSFAPRERERVVSPKIDKFDKDKERAEKTRRWIVDKESPKANEFGRKIGKAVSEPIAAIKSAWHGATDAWDDTMGNDTAPDPKPPVSVIPSNKWKGDKDNPALKENDELNQMRRIAGLKECGMEMKSQEDSMNVSTNMNSNGTKNVTISAEGDKADELLSMLKLAGMKHHQEAPIAIVSTDNEEMIEEGASQRLLKKIGDASAGAKIYKDMEWNEFIVKFYKDGQMLPEETWHHTNDMDDAVGTAEHEVARMSSMLDEYANSPEQEYHSVRSITDQGNDLNRQKRQYAKRPRLGDNPMAESVFDADLEAMLESILIRERVVTGPDGKPLPRKVSDDSGYVRSPEEEKEHQQAVKDQEETLRARDAEIERKNTEMRKQGQTRGLKLPETQDNEPHPSNTVRNKNEPTGMYTDPETGRVRMTFPPSPPRKIFPPNQSEFPLQTEPYHGPRSFKIDGEPTGHSDDESEIYEEEKPTWLQRQPSKSQEEIAQDWDARVKASGDYVPPAERPYRDEKTGRMITPPRGATNPPPDSEFPPGDPRNSRPLKPARKK